jgi:hypothetical protein
MIVASNAKAQKSIELTKEKKAKMAITAQIARWHEKYSQHSLLYIYIYIYIYILRAPQLGGSHGSE